MVDRPRRLARILVFGCIAAGGIEGCARARGAGEEDPDAGANGPVDASLLEADALEFTEDVAPRGSRGHCCTDGVLASCFCPEGAACRFGTACASGGCVEGDGAACEGGVADAADQ